MKEYMPYEGANDPFAGVDFSSVVEGVGEDGEIILDTDSLQLNTDVVGIPTLPIREPVVFTALGEEVALLADVTHNLRIGDAFGRDARGDGAERAEELGELFHELAVAYYAYRKRPGGWLN